MVPRPILNQPSACAIRSAGVRTLGPELTIFGSPFDLATLARKFIASTRMVSRLQHHLDAGILLVAEHAIHLRSLLQRDAVRDDEGGIDLPLLDPPHQVVGP